ncbi:thyrotropin-releasing hormone-degrading ectoenzyme [Halyomorpha halys]|uniref:thyrotropin-releasing hormone-degrading ectoenzyme n=1 Tax=Halyomorpha halys TaxID=286706 RepID=UPI0006D50000
MSLILTIVFSNKKLVTADYESPVDLPPYGVFFTIGSYNNLDSRFPVYFPKELSAKDISQDLWDAVTSTVVSDLDQSADVKITLVVVPGLNVPSVSGYGIAAISRDVCLDVKGSSIDSLKDQALQLLRASVHSFFTSVVSPSSWENMWLAESIPTYIAHAALNQMKTNWKNWPDTELLDLQQSALTNSWSTSSSPVIATNLNTTSKILNFASDPAIIKGSAFLGMLETLASNPITSFVGYVKELKGKSVSTEDFLTFYAKFNNMNQTLPDGKTLWTIFKPWLLNSGYPYLTVFRGDHEVRVNKKRFQDSDQTGWMLPLSFQTYFVNKTSLRLGASKNYIWLDDKVNGNYVIVSDNSHNLLVVFNVNGPAPYRVLYDESSLQLLRKELEANVNYLNKEYLRSTLISDNFAFAKSGLLSYVSVFDTLRYLSSETSLGPWTIANDGFRQLWNLIYFSDLRLQFQNYVTDLMRNSYRYYGIKINDADFIKGKIVKLIVSSMCDYGDEVCRRDTKAAYQTYIVGKKSVANTAIVDELYCNGLRDLVDKQSIMQLLQSSYQTTLTTYQKQSLFYYLSCAGGDYGNSQAINSLLESVLVTTNGIDMPAEDIIVAFKQIASKPQHYEEALSYFINNYYQIKPKLVEDEKAELIRYLGALGSTDEHINIFGNFTFKNASSNVIVKAVQDAVKSAQTNKQFMSNHYEDIYNGLNGVIPPSTLSPSTITPTNPTITPPSSTPSPSGASFSAIAFPTLLMISGLILRYLN